MAIGTGAQRAVFSQSETRRGHRSGSSYGKLFRDSGARLDTAIVPDESGTMGCALSLSSFASTIQISGTVYAVYLGRATGGKKLDSVSMITTAAGTGAAAGAVGFATTVAGPDFTDKADLTVRAVAAIDTVAATGRRSNLSGLTVGSAAYNAALLGFVPATGQHIWAFSITTNASTQATAWALSGEVGAGEIQVVTGQTVAAAVVGKVYTTAVRPAASITAFQAPQFFIV